MIKSLTSMYHLRRLSSFFHTRLVVIVVVPLSIGILQTLFVSVRAQQHSLVYLPFVPSTTPFVLSSFKPYATSQYSGAFIGEVRNVSATESYSVTVQAVFQMNLGATTEIVTVTRGVQVPILAPNTASPVIFYFSNPIPEVIRTTIIFSEKRTSRTSMLTVIPERIVCTTGFYGYVTGIVRNTTLQPIIDAQVHLWSMRDDYSRGYANASLPATMLSGEEAAFASSLLPLCDYPDPSPGVSPESFTFVAQGLSK